MNAILKFRLLLLACCCLSGKIKSQDLILKTNGDSIKAKITEIGTNGISYKKFDYQNGPTYVEDKSNILLIKLASGEIQKFAPAVANTATTSIMTNTSIPTNSAVTSNSTSTLASNDSKIKIERDGKKFTINGQKASRKKVNEQLSKSKNPLVIVPLKAAKLTKGAQTIVKLTSIPTSIGGGFAILVTGVDLYNDIRRGRDNTKTYTGILTSLVGTITLPITNKLLKNKSDKMYDKIIDAYNLTN